jgi:hypothetical protein
MKKFLFSLILLLVSYVGFSQKGLSYQAVILDPTKIEVPGQDISGQPLVNGDVWMKFSIFNGSTLQFEEVHKTKTDNYGLVNLLIGSVSSASFNSLVWDSSQKSLQVFVSFNQGGSYTKISDQKLNYNPYALFAETAGKLSGVLPVANGGTGATTAADARANLGLDQVNNTSDVAKPVSTATKAALDLKANASDVAAGLALKANAADVATSFALKANSNDMTAALAAKADTGTIKTFVVTQVAAANIPDADATTKGKIKIAGDLAGTADAPTVPGLTLKADAADVTAALALKANTADVNSSLALKANTTSLSRVATTGIYNDLINKPTIPAAYTLPVASASALGGIKIGANLSIDANGVLSAAGSSNASSISGVVPVANGGTGTTTVAGIRYALGFSDSKVAIGDQAGLTNQGGSTVGVGGGAGATNQGGGSVAVGYVAGYNNQGNASVAIGSNAAQSGQGTQAVALGFAAGQNGQGAYSVAVGSYAGNVQAANSIALNATGTSLNPSTTGFYVAPIRNASSASSLYYNTATKEITYGAAGASGAIDLATGVTGTLPIANGGTGQTTLAGVKNTLGLTSSKLSIGSDAGLTNQGNNAIALGYNAGLTNQGASSIAIGYLAGGTATQGSSSIAIGPISGGGGNQSVAIGLAAWTGANNATAVGTLAAAGQVNSTAIGYQAVTTSPNTIQLGADGVTVAGSTAITNVRTSGSLTAGAVTYPNTNGTAGQVLTANNDGNASWTTVAGTLPTTVNTSANYNIVMATGSNAALVTGTGNGGNAATLNPYTGQMSVSGLTAQGYGITSPIYASTPQTLTDATTIAWNPLNGLNANVTLGGNRTLNFSGSLIAGSYGTLVVTQDATGGRTLTLPSVANKVLGSSSTTTIALSTAAGAKDIVNFYYDGTNYFWNVGQGYGTASSSSSTANLATGVTGTLAVANGGTGATTLTGLVKGSGTGALTAAVAGTDYLAPNGNAANLSNFPTLNQNTTGNAANVTGIVSVANGGTGTTNGSITGTTALSFAAGGSNQNVSILPSGTGSVGIGTNSPNSLAILDASSTTKGFLPPRMTYAQKIAISSPPQGLMIYCTNCGTNGEPEYFNGSSWVNMAGGAAASVPITLGSTYGGGKVFYILQSGDPGYVAGETHGLIAATSDTQGYRVFGCRGWPAGTSTALGTGAANTTTLLGCSESNFAAKLARAVTDGGYSNWNLPSKDELNKLYLNRNSVGNFIDVNYWSSSEDGPYFAFYQNFSDGTQSNDDKNAQKGIRAIRSF